MLSDRSRQGSLTVCKPKYGRESPQHEIVWECAGVKQNIIERAISKEMPGIQRVKPVELTGDVGTYGVEVECEGCLRRYGFKVVAEGTLEAGLIRIVVLEK